MRQKWVWIGKPSLVWNWPITSFAAVAQRRSVSEQSGHHQRFMSTRPSLAPPLEGGAKIDDLGIEFQFRVVVHSSQVIVDLETTRGEASVEDLRNFAVQCARIHTDLIGYMNGCCFEVDIVSAVSRESAEWRVFGIDVPVLVERRGYSSLEPFQATIDANLFSIVASSSHAQIVLADFREAMRSPIGTGFFCYRAIEAMMQFVRKADDAEKVAWQRLREYLHVDRAAIEAVKAYADAPRHGRPSSITDTARARVFAITDELIRRFLAFLQRGSLALPGDEYPMFFPPNPN